jgi:membrane-bound acyltransferase YfiQ involved in biofilm formation
MQEPANSMHPSLRSIWTALRIAVAAFGLFFAVSTWQVIADTECGCFGDRGSSGIAAMIDLVFLAALAPFHAHVQGVEERSIIKGVSVVSCTFIIAASFYSVIESTRRTDPRYLSAGDSELTA